MATTLGTLRIVQKENSRERIKIQPLMYRFALINNNVNSHAVVDW